MITAGAEELQDVVRDTEPGRRLLPVAGGTKPSLSRSGRDDVTAVDVSGLRGIVEYDPAELTFTALAGTPVAEVAAALAEHGQYLPFDPPFAASGATLGGAVAAGAAGPNAFRHGGVRDFVIGVRFVDGDGRLVAGGGKVVKNAAGFDFSKLLVGSMGRLGVMVQLAFKVFPRPRATTTLAYALGSTAEAVAAVSRLARGPLDLDALDVEPGGRLLVRLAGHPDALDARAARLTRAVGTEGLRHDGAPEAALWSAAAELAWLPPGSAIVRVGLTTRSVAALDEALAGSGARARYSLGGNVAWVAWPSDAPLDALDALLRRMRLTGMVLAGPADRPLLGAPTGGAFAQRVRRALDPHARFLED